MMNRLKISRILIKNFKHIEKLLVDVSKKDLVILDGPNGYGKTTVFDAVELVLTGKISRIKNTADGRLGYGDILFANNSNLDTEIRVEFISENDSVTIAKRIDSKRKLKPFERKPDNWELFETYRLFEFSDSIEEAEMISTDDVGKILSINNLERYFSLFYYVQQEENTLFLKQNAKDRMEEISQLFDTYQEEEELEKLKAIKSKITNEVRRLSGTNGVLDEKKKSLSILQNRMNDAEEHDIKEVEYFKLFQEEDYIKDWDKKIIELDKTSREKFLQELRDIYSFVRDKEHFINTEFNNKIHKVIEDRKLLSNTILTYNFLEDYDYIKRQKDKEKTVKKIKNRISRKNFNVSLEPTYLLELQGVLDIEIDIDDIKYYLSNLQSYKSKMGEISEVIKDLNDTRDTLMSHYNKVKEEFENTNCPLCGSRYTSYKELIDSIKSKGELFTQMLDEDTEKFNKIYEELFIKHIDNILLTMERYLFNKENIIDEEFYQVFIKAIASRDSINSFSQWCEENNLNIVPFLNTNYIYPNNIDTQIQKIIGYLLTNIKEVDKTYSNHRSNVETFNVVFNGDFDKTHRIELSDIEKKARYINYQYYYNSSENINKLKEEIDQVSARLEQVEKSEQKIKELVKVYEEKIFNHWKKIIRDIEIPFYIYSGKIIQNYQRGCGLFIYENDKFEQKSIRFVSDIKSNHDAINYLSSGQLSGLVIAFTLALNKIYGENSINLIMIDDPVQTMDEINVASLTELLRNEFSEKQIIMSTHEEEVSRYIRYKFSKYNLKTMKINIKDEIYS